MAKKLYDCIVVGGGAAGMMSAITAARNNMQVLLIEGTSRLGNKILQTGNGKCNFTNYNMDADMYNNDNHEFISSALKMFNQYDAVDFFKSVGVFHRERNGYVYPHSETAASLREALVHELDNKGVDVITDVSVHSIRKDDGVFVVNDRYKAVKLIITAGSKAAPKTGSDGSGYQLALSLGHSIIKPLPSLVQLISDNKYCKQMAGVRSTGTINLYCDKSIYSDYGEIQYTDYGISGIPVFQISHHAVKSLYMNEKVYADIDMIPDYSKEELMEYVYENADTANKTIEQMFSGILNRKLVAAACARCSVDSAMPASLYNIKKIELVISSMKKFRFNITGNKSFDNAQVCQGGVSLDEINPETMESCIVEGLYFAGEIMDVDGKCGGYNLQWAWTSGYIAGISAANDNKENTDVKSTQD